MTAIVRKSKAAVLRSAFGEDQNTIFTLHEKNTKSLEFQFLESAPRSDKQRVSKLFAHENTIRRLQNVEEIFFQLLSGKRVNL